ncbi:MAG: RdgB/HAM1 family non-canonical purine NTP pyrophosphatase [Oscillatoriales cyanobacterium SM2_2_1]|nr:RdgB/HAM1 family non-canonical purine NTP pyrophosphatase [Oscillatoriales cyanobacterium SM2_2_1]
MVRERRLVIASGNRGKVQEFEEYLAAFALTLVPKPEYLDIEETGATFLDNAQLKASQVAVALGEWAIADDSGLVVHALGGKPGVYSARYGATDGERIQRLLGELEGQSDRRAEFVCAIAIADPQGHICAQSEGICAGEIIHHPLGEQGFGYDPIFREITSGLTFGQLPPERKSEISHRAKALVQLYPQLMNLPIMAPADATGDGDIP